MMDGPLKAPRVESLSKLIEEAGATFRFILPAAPNES
jgi:hypothetical protein